MSLFFKMLSGLIIAFPPRCKCLLISWLQSLSAVILEPKKIKSVTISIVSPSICYEMMGPDTMILVFWVLSFKPAFSLSSFTFGFRGSSAGKESSCKVGDLGSIPGLGKSPGEGKGYPLQYSGLENSMDCIVHGVSKSRTELSGFHFHLCVLIYRLYI